MPFINNAVDPKHIKGTKMGLVDILDTYDKTQQVFVVGGKKLSITASEFEVIFGIASGPEDIDMKNSTIGDDSLGNHLFADTTIITPRHLKEEILKAMKGTDQHSVEDTVKLLILHVMACVLFVASTDIARWLMMRICLYELRSYNWGKCVVEYVMNFVQTSSSEEVRGCTAVLHVSIPPTTNIITTFPFTNYKIMLTCSFGSASAQSWCSPRIQMHSHVSTNGTYPV